jgi:hypothetical protein
MIYIDFQGGAHGNYLEFVCNRFLANVPVNKPTPFSSAGTAHEKQYLSNPVFCCDHYSLLPDAIPDSKIISIQIIADDLLPLTSISLLRAGDFGLDNDLLEIDTYNKLVNIPVYQWVLDNLIDSFFRDQIRESYNAVRGDDWPDISTLEEFNALPDWMRDECINVHHLELLQLDENHPDCPRHILREFFKIGFKYPEQSGFMVLQKSMIYKSNPIIFPFGAFYHSDRFLEELQKLAGKLGYTIADADGLLELHQAFLDRQPYKYSKRYCDELIDDVVNGKEFDLPKLDLLKESYITAKLEQAYGKEYNRKGQWFLTSQEIRRYFGMGIGSVSLDLHTMNPVVGPTTTIKISVRQDQSIIAETQIADVTTEPKSVDIEFRYKNYNDPIVLELEFLSEDNDNPIKIIDLVIDDLFSIRKLLHQGQLLSRNDESWKSVGNTLYGDSRLVYEFPLPIYGPTKGS